MKKIIFLFFTFGIFGTFGQISAQLAVITDFNSTTHSISFGAYSLATEHCTFWIHSPSAGQIQIACYVPNNPVPTHNEIDTISPTGFSGTWVFADGTMSWIIQPNQFHLAGAGSDNIEVHKDGTF